MAARGEHEYAVVEAAQRGALWAQDELVGAYLPLVYNIVGRALNGHADVDDVVQETMLRALRGLGSLHDAGSFRSWLVAITMNQIRTYQYRQQVAPAGSELQDAYDVADPGADFVDLTIVRLGLEGQRREVAEATRWLDGDDRVLLSLWWLEAVGELSRAEVSAALEVSPQHTAVRVQRMKAQLETARLVVRALSATPLCDRLDQLIGNWDRRPSPLWRKRIARHARDCVRCSGHQADLFPAEGLLVGLGLVPVAAALTGLAGLTAFAGTETAAATTAFGVPPVHGHSAAPEPDHAHGHPEFGTPSGSAGEPTAVLASMRAARAGGRRHGHRKPGRISQRGRITGVAAAVAVLITGGTVATLSVQSDGEGDTVRSAADTQGEAPTQDSSSAPAASSASPSPSASKSPSAKPRAKSPKPEPTPSRTKQAAEPTTPAPRPSTTPAAAPADTSAAAQVLALVNTERQKAGCQPVTLDARLARAAQLHSEDMSKNQYFDHTSQDGRTFADRAAAQGHPSPGAENIAQGQSTPEAVMESWMNSQGHRENILNCDLTTMGVGVVEDDWTWTQVFGF
ncbi:RNA polymerase ECF-subfamily sigma factor [Streptomyces davaonensis JCM 4913]|uniref:RNA polymerase sigma factor n=1 Tax=Streptomyces davaonensis (strain DSM 101723 / JCM 4913 / KCC S-0913 / 768) TaxID=1214101 RepID=K4QXI2_STRDJ|nr:sigma-70 family RNA polymerase sigma factor [Streptomyces davaonensis]CCK25637.1 RNA polymerase ECF-subfamily sigma factor [Streptomyces davaonensis JCM 4913]